MDLSDLIPGYGLDSNSPEGKVMRAMVRQKALEIGSGLGPAALMTNKVISLFPLKNPLEGPGVRIGSKPAAEFPEIPSNAPLGVVPKGGVESGSIVDLPSLVIRPQVNHWMGTDMIRYGGTAYSREPYPRVLGAVKDAISEADARKMLIEIVKERSRKE